MNEILRYVLIWVTYLFLQIFLFNHLVLFQVNVPFVFLIFILALPFDLQRPILYGVSFLTGLLVDIFSENMATGLHAFSCVLIAAIRPYVIGFISSSNVRNISEINIRSQNTIWLVSYLLPMVFVYHLAYYLMEALTFTNFLVTLLKVLGGTMYCFIWGIFITYVFYKR